MRRRSSARPSEPGAISQRTERIELMTGGHLPDDSGSSGDVAQAAATAASLLPGRFSLGVGPGQDGFFDFYEREVLPSFG